MDTVKHGIIVGVVAGVVAPVTYEVHDLVKRWKLEPLIGTAFAIGASMAAFVRVVPDGIAMTSAEFWLNFS